MLSMPVLHCTQKQRQKDEVQEEDCLLVCPEMASFKGKALTPAEVQEGDWLLQHQIMEAAHRYLRTGPPSIVPPHILQQGRKLSEKYL